jgi:1,4-dihydroxy-2-naphthoate octaprenyltransferase
MASIGGRALNRPATWGRAFVGFYRPTDADALATLDPLSRFLYSARSVILVISAQAAAIAGLLALTDRRFAIVPFVLVLIAFVLLHAISNLSNDYFGYRRGHDTAESPRLSYTLHPVASGALTPRMLLGGVLALVAGAVAILAYFLSTRGLGVLWFALAGAALLYLYDAAPVTLKAFGLGELASFAVWGPIMVGGGYYAITGHVSRAAFLASVPYGLGVMSILTGKHIDQSEFDRTKNQRTLPLLLGERRARRLNQAIVVGMYVVVAAGAAIGWLAVSALVAFVAAPRALAALRTMAHPRPSEPPAGYVGWPLWYHRTCLVHNRLFGWAYIAGLAVGAAWPTLRLG